MSFPYMPFPIPPFPWKHMHWRYQPYVHNIPESCGNLMVDLNQLHNWQTPLIDLNSINVGSNIPSPYGQDLKYPEGNVIGVSCTRDKTGTADNFMNDLVHFNSFQNPEIDRNFTQIRGNACGGYEMPRQSGEAYTNNIHGPLINNFVGLEGSTPMLYDTQDYDKININNNDEVCTAQFCCPKKIDGSFLSLGIGGNTNVKSKSDLSSREIPGDLSGAVSPQLNTSYVRPDTGSSLNLGHNLVGGFSSFQNNFGGFTSLGHQAGAWTSSNNNVGFIKADMQCGFPTSSTHNLGIVGNRDARYANLDPNKGFIDDLAASSGPFSSRSARLLDSGQTGASELASESVKVSWAATQPTSDQLHKRFMESPESSSMVSSFIWFKGSSARQEHSGQLLQTSKYSVTPQPIDEGTQLPRRKHVQPAGQLFSAIDGTAHFGAAGGLFPKMIGVQVSKDSAAQAARSGLFPLRLGVQVDEHTASQAAGDGLFSKSTGVHATDSRVACAAECGLYPKEMGFWTASTGQVISTAKGCGLSQASNVLDGPSLKRIAIRPPPAAPLVQRRKITLKPPILASMPSSLQTAPAACIPIPSPHVKWQGFDGLPQPTGQKCLLCKRDLSFRPEGPVYQPTVPPAVAVLPCGHTFHDHCLQIITPEDQSKNPPCIPCAIGEL